MFGFGKDGWDWKKELDAPGARSMTHLAKFMATLGREEFLARVPDQSLLDGDEGKAGRLKSDRITASRTTDGTLVLCYSANGRPIGVKLDKLASGRATAAWFNPRTGRWHAGGLETETLQPFAEDLLAGPGAPGREFVPPTSGDGNDWVLVLRASAK